MNGLSKYLACPKCSLLNNNNHCLTCGSYLRLFGNNDKEFIDIYRHGYMPLLFLHPIIPVPKELLKIK